MSTWAGVDDREPPMAQRNGPTVLIDWLGIPNAVVVATPMLDSFEHSFNPWSLNSYDSGNTAHGF